MFRIHHAPQTICGARPLPATKLSDKAPAKATGQAVANELPTTPRLPHELWSAVVAHLGPRDALPLRQTHSYFLRLYNDQLPDAFHTTLLRDWRNGNALVGRDVWQTSADRARTLDAYDEKLLAMETGGWAHAFYDWESVVAARLRRTRQFVGQANNLRTLSVDLLSFAAIFDRGDHLPNLQRLCLVLAARWEARFAANLAALMPLPLHPPASVTELSLSFHPGFSDDFPSAQAYTWVGKLFAGGNVTRLNVYAPHDDPNGFDKLRTGLLASLPTASLRHFALQIAPGDSLDHMPTQQAHAFFTQLFDGCHAGLETLRLETPNRAGEQEAFGDFVAAMAPFTWSKLHTVYLGGSTVAWGAPVALADAKKTPALRTVVMPNTITTADLLQAFADRQDKVLRHVVVSAAVPTCTLRQGDRLSELRYLNGLFADLRLVKQQNAVEQGDWPAELMHLQTLAFARRTSSSPDFGRPDSFVDSAAQALVRDNWPNTDFFVLEGWGDLAHGR